VRALRSAGVDQVSLEVKPGAEPAVAAVRLSAEARFGDFVSLLAELSRPGSGLVLQRVDFSTAGTILKLQVEAVALGGGS
jgi:hypothetical protein